jgi:molybdopterin converting factor subunit 1
MKVLFFSQARRIAGCTETQLDIGDGVDIDGLWAIFLREHPGLAAIRDQTRIAQNGRFADAHARFSSDDEVALIPPVSGG